MKRGLFGLNLCDIIYKWSIRNIRNYDKQIDRLFDAAAQEKKASSFTEGKGGGQKSPICVMPS